MIIILVLQCHKLEVMIVFCFSACILCFLLLAFKCLSMMCFCLISVCMMKGRITQLACIVVVVECRPVGASSVKQNKMCSIVTPDMAAYFSGTKGESCLD